MIATALGLRADIGLAVSGMLATCLQPKTSLLTPAAFEGRQAKGRDMSVEQGIEYALQPGLQGRLGEFLSAGEWVLNF